MKFTNIFAFIITANILITGCKGSGESDSSSSSNNEEIQLGDKLSINLSRSNSLFLAPQGAVENSSNNNTIYSLNPDNTITEVSILIHKDLKTGKITNYKHTKQKQPTGFYDTKSFILISYEGVYKGSKRCSIVPVRKSDGALFCLDLGISPKISDNYSENIQSNSSGTIIVINQDSGLSSLDLTDPNNPTVKEITSSKKGEYIYDFSVNSDGDVLVQVGISNIRITKVFNKNSGFEPFSTEHYTGCLINGVSGDESSFYFTEPTNYGNTVLQKIIKSNGKYIKETYSNANIFNTCINNSIAKIKDKIYINSYAGSFLEAVNPSKKPVKIKSNFSKITKIIPDDNHLIILGINHLNSFGIERFNTTLNTFSQVLSPGEYTIASLSVSKSGVITFMGRRASDSARVLGTISKDSNKLTIVNQSLNGDISKIVSLN
jgi:hypothetical protein